jgi:hypothetical protein
MLLEHRRYETIQFGVIHLRYSFCCR